MLYALVVAILLWPALAVAGFDMGFDFRQTALFSSDPSFGVPVLGEAFPTTYTAANGFSLNGGWTGGVAPGINEAAGNDARIAGVNYAPAFTTNTFKMDLASGSAPGSGSYTIDMAIGEATQGQTQDLIVKDNATAVITISNTPTLAGHYIDATLVDVAATTNWTGTTTTKTFASTTANIVVNPSSQNIFTTVAHFRLTQAGGGPPPQRSLTGVGL